MYTKATSAGRFCTSAVLEDADVDDAAVGQLSPVGVHQRDQVELDRQRLFHDPVTVGLDRGPNVFTALGDTGPGRCVVAAPLGLATGVFAFTGYRLVAFRGPN